MPARLSPAYHAAELLCTSLGEGKSARLYEQLVEAKRYLNTIEVYTTQTADPGLLIVNGTLNEGVSFEQVDEALLSIFATVQA